MSELTARSGADTITGVDTAKPGRWLRWRTLAPFLALLCLLPLALND